MPRLNWPTAVGCQGGPILLADVDAYPRWSGARRDPSFQRIVRYWGEFVGELPRELRSGGGGDGDQQIECDSHDEALAARDRVQDAILGEWPDSKVTEENGVLNLVRGDGKRMWIELGPSSEYDLACREGVDQKKAAWTYHNGDAELLLWEVGGGGTVEVGLAQGGEEIVLARTWASQSGDRDRVRALVDQRQESEQVEAEVHIASGAAALVWAPAHIDILEGVSGADDLRDLAKSGSGTTLGTELISDLGTVLKTGAGRYQAAVGRHEDPGGWSCRWCRLTLAAS